MGKSKDEKKRLREKLRNIDSLIKALEGKSDNASKEELRRQKTERDNIKYELDKG